MKGKTFLVLFLGLFIAGCSQKEFSANKDTVHLENIKRITELGYYQNDSLSLFKEFTLAGYVGPSMALSKDEYLLEKYSDKPLLFANYGIKDRIYLLTGSSNLDEKDAKAREYGFKNLNDMFEYLFFFWTKKESSVLEENLKFLAKKGLINLEAFKKDNLEKANNDLIFNTYGNYMYFEDINEVKLLDEWFFTVDNKKIKFSKDDYKPYSFITTLITELFKNNNNKGVILNGL